MSEVVDLLQTIADRPTADELEEVLVDLEDAVAFLGGRRVALDRYVAAVLGGLGPEVPPEEAARLAWRRALAAMRWAADHAPEVEAAVRRQDRKRSR
jgi:hypothetical protein